MALKRGGVSIVYEVNRIEAYQKLMRKCPDDKLSMRFVINKLENMGFFTAPASTRYHGVYEGGLFDHSLEVTKYLIDLTEKLDIKWANPRSPYVVGMFHDLCKCDSYLDTGEVDGKTVYTYNNETLLKGHGDKSVMLLSSIISLTDEEVACIRYHMGAFTKKKEWNNYTRAVHKYATVLYSHTADMLASHVKGV